MTSEQEEKLREYLRIMVGYLDAEIIIMKIKKVLKI